jgi:hypothetical protein
MFVGLEATGHTSSKLLFLFETSLIQNLLSVELNYDQIWKLLDPAQATVPFQCQKCPNNHFYGLLPFQPKYVKIGRLELYRVF